MIFYCLLAWFLGFLLSGMWFGIQLLLKCAFSKTKHKNLTFFAPLFAASVPTALIVYLTSSYFLNLSALSDLKMWFISAVTLAFACLIKSLGEKRHRTIERQVIALMCMEAAFVEIAQRLMMQSFIMYLLDFWRCDTILCIPLNALVWCAGIAVQTIVTKQKVGRDFAIDITASFVFSIGCGYVFYKSGCIIFSIIAHTAERFIMTKLDR